MTARLLALVLAAAEPGTEAAPFLTTDVGARAAAMGGAYTAVAEGAAGVNWNAAALGFLERGEIAGLHFESPFGENYEYLAYARPVGLRWGVGLSAIYLFSRDEIRDEFDDLGSFTNSDLAVTIAAGRRLTEALSIGLSAKYVRERLFVFNADAFALDAGLLFRRGAWSAGATVQNYGERIRFLSQSDPLPLRLRLGTSYDRRRLRLALDAIFATETKPGYGVGLEYRVLEALALRGGYRFNHDGRGASSLAAGLGVRLADLSANYAYVPFGDVGASHRIEVAYALGPRLAAETAAAPAPGEPRYRVFPPRLALLRDLNLRGTWTFAQTQTSITNPEVVGRVPGGSSLLDYAAVGGTPAGLNVAISSSLSYDNWDRFEPRRVQVNVSSETFEVAVGHHIQAMTDLTLTSQQVIGAGGTTRIEDEAPAAIPAPPGSLLGGKRPPLGKWYRERGIAERPAAWEVRAFAGQTARPVDVGDRIPFQNGDLATFGIFEEFTYGAEVRRPLHPLLDLGLRLVRVEDDPASITSFGTTRPQSSTTASLDILWRAATGLTDLSGEYAWSLHDPDRLAAGGERNDWAGHLRIEHRFPSREGRRLQVTLERLGDEFEALGNPATRTRKDRQGLRGFLEWPFALGAYDGFGLRLDGEFRQDNLDRRLAVTTRTKEGRVSLGWANPRTGWSVRLGLQGRTDLSDATPDTTRSILHVNTRNEAFRLDLRAPVAPWASLDAGYARSIFENGTVFSGASAPSDLATTVWRAGLNSAPGKFGGAEWGVSWTGIRTLFSGTAATQTTTDVWNARAGFQVVPEKMRLNAFASFQSTDGPTQDEAREEIGANVRYVLSPARALRIEFRRFRDLFEPAVRELDYEGYSIETRLTTVF